MEGARGSGLRGQETMPEGERESISEVKPTGWQSVEYEDVDGGYLTIAAISSATSSPLRMPTKRT